jgi:hypothetical protein
VLQIGLPKFLWTSAIWGKTGNGTQQGQLFSFRLQTSELLLKLLANPLSRPYTNPPQLDERRKEK